MCLFRQAVQLSSLWLLCALLPTAQSQSLDSVPEVRILAGSTVAFSGEMAFQGQVRVKLPLGIPPSIEPFVLWREHATRRGLICPIVGPCPIETVRHNDVIGMGTAVTFDLGGSGISENLGLYFGGSLARYWQFRDDSRVTSAAGFIFGGQLFVAPAVSLGGEVQLGFSHELGGGRRGVTISPLLQLVVGG